MFISFLSHDSVLISLISYWVVTIWLSTRLLFHSIIVYYPIVDGHTSWEIGDKHILSHYNLLTISCGKATVSGYTVRKINFIIKH